MYSSPKTCKHYFESSFPRLFEYRVGIEPVIKSLRDVDDLRLAEEVKDLRNVDDPRRKKIKVKVKVKEKEKKHKKIKRNKIFAALCESSDDDEYSRINISEDINYETKRVNVYDPASVIEHKEDDI